MNYIDADKLRAEIEKNTPNHLMLMVYRDHILALIDSLQQEQPEEPDKSLEEEVKNYFQGYWPGTETAEQCNTDLHFTPPAIIRLARHFYELGKQAMKEQMLKDAVEGNIHLVGFNNAVFIKEPKAEILDRYNVGDKVRIVIVKED